MKSLFPHESFADFGPARLHPPGFLPLRGQGRGRRGKQLRMQMRESAPQLPGIYGMIDRRGVLVYVGKAKRLRARLMSYFRVNSRDPKAGKIIDRTDRIVWETSPDEFSALIRELELIQRFRPVFNVQGQPGRQRYVYVCLGRAPAPFAFVARNPSGNEQAIYGPLVGAAKSREAVRRLNDLFRLRDCPQRQKMHFLDQPDLFDSERSPGCLRYDIGACLGPCARLCSRDDYAERVRSTRRFLDGIDRSQLQELEKEMESASLRQQYERASALRDKIAELRWLTDRLVWLRHARMEHSFVYPLAGADNRTVWYLIERGQVRAALYPPTSKSTRQIFRRTLDQIDAGAKDLGTLMNHRHVDSVLLVAAWFRKRPAERQNCLPWDDAKANC